MFHNISNPKWFGKWSRLEDDYLYNDGTDTSGNFVFSKMELTGGLFGSIISLATAFPACDPETGHATGVWKVACESIDLEQGSMQISTITSVLELALKRVRKSLMRVRHPLTSKARFFPPASREPSKNPSPIKQRFPKENARLSTFWLLMSERIRPEMT